MSEQVFVNYEDASVEMLKGETIRLQNSIDQFKGKLIRAIDEYADLVSRQALALNIMERKRKEQAQPFGVRLPQGAEPATEEVISELAKNLKEKQEAQKTPEENLVDLVKNGPQE
ncbi:MAG: hypothetical protein KDD43_00080 [Bdellovibrionales bacterium]|nr:hypothetical protein [Bdellovibrionales bacterium]